MLIGADKTTVLSIWNPLSLPLQLLSPYIVISLVYHKTQKFDVGKL